MAADVIDRLRRERPACDLPAGDPGALFAEIVAGPRAAPPARASRPAGKRLALVLLAALAVAAPLAVAARTTHVFDFALGDPAPKPVSVFLDNMLLPAYGPKEGPPINGPTRKDIVRGSEQLVDEITTSSGVKARMYSVRLRTGGACFAALGGPFNGGSCITRAWSRRYPLTASLQRTNAPDRDSARNGTALYGRASSSRAASLIVHYEDGTSEPILLVHRWFMFELPAGRTRKGHQPTRIDVLDASGIVIATQHDPFILLRGPGPKPEKPIASRRVLARVPLGWKGAILELQAATGNRGHQCVRVVNSQDLIQSGNWWCGPEVAHTAPVSEGQTTKPPPVFFELHQFTKLGKPGGYVYARGWVGPRIARLEIRMQDSTVEQIPLHDRLFLYVVPQADWPLGKRPSYVIGRDAGGRVVYRRFLYPAGRCAYPVADKRCAQIIVHNG
jgi:hypothetical protein